MRVLSDSPVFKDVTKNTGIDYTHQSSGFVDFKTFPLLPFQLSQTRSLPSEADDVNGDGLEDIFIGASAGNESVLYLQTGEGKFVVSPVSHGMNKK